MDLPLERDAAVLEDARADALAELLELGRGGAAGVDQEVAVLVRDHRPAVAQAAAAGGVDQLPGPVPGGFLPPGS